MQLQKKLNKSQTALAALQKLNQRLMKVKTELSEKMSSTIDQHEITNTQQQLMTLRSREIELQNMESQNIKTEQELNTMLRPLQVKSQAWSQQWLELTMLATRRFRNLWDTIHTQAMRRAIYDSVKYHCRWITQGSSVRYNTDSAKIAAQFKRRDFLAAWSSWGISEACRAAKSSTTTVLHTSPTEYQFWQILRFASNQVVIPIDLVEYDARHVKVVQRCFGNAVIAANDEIAAQLANKLHLTSVYVISVMSLSKYSTTEGVQHSPGRVMGTECYCYWLSQYCHRRLPSKWKAFNTAGQVWDANHEGNITHCSGIMFVIDITTQSKRRAGRCSISYTAMPTTVTREPRNDAEATGISELIGGGICWPWW